MDLGKIITRKMRIKGIGAIELSKELGVYYSDIKSLEEGDYNVLKGITKTAQKKLCDILGIGEFPFLIATGNIPESIKEELKTAFMADGNTRGVLKLLRNYNSINGVITDEEELRRTGGKIYQSPKVTYND